MNILTNRSASGNVGTAASAGQVLARLAEYEETGFLPEDIRQVDDILVMLNESRSRLEMVYMTLYTARSVILNVLHSSGLCEEAAADLQNLSDILLFCQNRVLHSEDPLFL